MHEKFANLEQFLGGYFHQDWSSEADNDDQILCQYAVQASCAARLAVALEIAELLCASDCIIDETVQHLGLYYDPAIVGLDMRQWLIKVKDFLEAK